MHSKIPKFYLEISCKGSFFCFPGFNVMCSELFEVSRFLRLKLVWGPQNFVNFVFECAIGSAAI